MAAAVVSSHSFDNIPSTRQFVIQLDDNTSYPEHVLLKINKSSGCQPRPSDVGIKTCFSSHSTSSRNPSNVKREDSYNFYKSITNIHKWPGDDTYDIAKIQEWKDWRRKANLHMANTIIDEECPGLSRVSDLTTHPIENDIVFNVYKTTRSSEGSMSVLGVTSFSMFGIPRIQSKVDFDDKSSLHVDDLMPPDYDDCFYGNDDLPPDYNEVFQT
ncbi:unnamed protein product [Mytilus edulis]|uniref:Uncharacterized protein n=1 Tax=Mytilus edulis TaxID=6550 RepID=A0A8S3V7S5_MYTED|nr:unnamed protein product [Mytilus edulis]